MLSALEKLESSRGAEKVEAAPAAAKEACVFCYVGGGAGGGGVGVEDSFSQPVSPQHTIVLTNLRRPLESKLEY